MKTLLLQVSWFLLALSVILSVTVVLSIILRKKTPNTAKWSSWLSLAVSCVAVVVVLLTAGYLLMRIGHPNDDEFPCAAFGLRRNPNVTRSEKRYKDASLLWMIFTNNYPGVEKWTRWIAFGLCLAAVVSFAIVLKFSIGKDERQPYRKNMKFNIDLVNKLTRTSAHSGYEKMEPQISYIGKGKSLGKEVLHGKPRDSLRDVWAAYAALGVFCAALIGVILLNHFVSLKVEEGAQPNCVPFDYSPLALETNDPADFLKSSDEPLPRIDRADIVPRDQWMAKPPTDTRPLTLPVEHVVVMHTVMGNCYTPEACSVEIRRIQEYHMGPMSGLWDISSNFLVARDGRVYEGRGWDVMADMAGLYGNGSLGVLFTGTSFRDLPLADQLIAFKDLIDEGLRLGNIDEEYKLVVHPKSKRSLLRKVLQSWDHSSP